MSIDRNLLPTQTLLVAIALEKLGVLRLNFVRTKWWEPTIPPSAIPIMGAGYYYYEVSAR